MRISWWRKLFGKFGMTANGKKQPYRRKPLGVEMLEARLAPASKVWTGAVDSNWSTSGNWVGGTPTASDIAVFDTGAGGTNVNATINAGFAGSVAGIEIANYTGTITDSLAALNLGANGYAQIAVGSTFLAGANTISDTGNWAQTAGTFTAGTSTVNFTGAAQSLTSGGESFDNITHNGTGTLTLQDALTVTGTLTNTAGTLAGNGKDVLALTLSLADNFTAGTSNLGVGTGGVSMTGGTFTAPGSGKTFTDSGNFSNGGGTFTANGGTVSLTGAGQSISGANTFANLTKTVTIADTLTFGIGAANKTTVTGTLTLQGNGAANLLSLRSATMGTQWQIDAQGTRNVSFVDIEDGDNVSITAIHATSATDSLDNTHWTFVNGTAFSYDSAGGTISLVKSGANLEILNSGNTVIDTLTGAASLAVNGVANADDTLAINYTTGGTFSLTGGITFAGGSGAGVNTLQIIGGSFTTDTYNYTNAHDGSISLDAQTIDYTQLTPIINTGTAVNAVFNLPAAASTALVVDSGTVGAPVRLHSNNATFENTDFANPTGSLTINRGNAADTLEFQATSPTNLSSAISVGTGASPFATVTITNPLTLNVGTGNLTINASTIADNAVIDTTGGTTGNVAFNEGTSLTVAALDTINAKGTVSQTGAGTVSLGANVTTAGHNVSLAGTVTLSGSVQIATSGAAAGLGDIDLAAVTGAGHALTLNAGVGGVITATGAIDNVSTLTVANSGGAAFQSTVDAGTAGAVTLSDTTGTIAFQDNTQITTLITANHAYNLAFTGTTTTVANLATLLNTGTVTLTNGAGDTVTFTGGLTVSGAAVTASPGAINTGNLSVTAGSFNGSGGTITSGSVTQTNGALTAPGSSWDMSGNWSHSGGTFNANSGTVVFDGAAQSVTSGGASFANITHNAAGALTVADTLTLAGSFTNTAGNLDITSRIANIAGNWSWAAGTLTSTGSTVNFDGVAQSLTSGGQAFNNLSHNATGTLALQDALTIGLALDNETGTIDLNGKNLSVTGAVTNKATIELPGTNTETVTLAGGNDTTEGSWLYYGDNTAGPITIRDFGANDYFNLTINDTNATTAVYQLGAPLHAAGTLTVSGGTLNLSNQTETGNVAVNGPALLKGNGTINGNVSGSGTFSPGNSPGTLTINGNFTPSGTVVFDVNTPYLTAGTDYDQFVVSGTVNLGAATLSFNGTATAAAPNIVVTLIKNNSGTTTTASAGLANASLIPTIDGGLFKIFYNGGFNSNDVVLVDTSTPAITYVSPTFTSSAGTQVDGDLGTAGVQLATIGINAFPTIGAAMGAITASGQVIVNTGSYAEAVSVNGTKTLTITPGATVAVNSLASIAGTTIQINGTSLTGGDTTSTTIAGTLTGPGQLAKQGGGVLTLSGTNNYTGTTTVSGGTLQVTSSLTNLASPVNLTGANAVLDGAGTGQILRPIVISASGAQVTNLTVNTMTTTLDGITVQSGANNVTLSTDAVTGNRNGINANGVSGLQLTSVNVTGAVADGFLGTGLTGTTTISGTSHFDTNARGMALSGGGGALLATGATFSSNTVIGSGGGIDIGAGAGNVNLISDIIASNSATVAGGGISLDAGYANILTLTGTTVGGATVANANTAVNGGGVNVAAGTLTLKSAVISNNSASANGGGLSVTGGTVNIEADTVLAASSQIVSNTATISGGGINVSGGAVNFLENLPNVLIGAVSFFNSVPAALVQNNTASTGNGGGFNVSGGALSLNVATISGNSAATGNGGGLNASAGTITLANSTFTANSAKANGGGGISFSGTNASTLTSVTVSGNNAGDGIEVDGGTVNLTNDTIANNLGGGVNRTAGAVSAINTVFANDPAAFDFRGVVTSLGHNLFQNTTGVTGTVATDLLNERALLAALANYGGPTATQALLPGSAALNAGATTAAAADQRGVARPVGGAYDVGAFESLGFTVTRIATPDPTTANETPAGDTKYRTLIDHHFVGTDGATPSIFAAQVVANDPNLTNLAGGVLNFLTPAGSASATASGAITNVVGNVVTSANHGLVTGQQVTITGIVGDTAANGIFTITVVDANTFSLNGVVGNGAYVSGGAFAAASSVGIVAGTTGTSATPIIVTGIAHGFVTGQKVTIAGVTGDTAANGTFTVTVIDANHFSLNGTTGNGAYTGGGTYFAANTGGAITAATNAGPIVITSANHGLATGEQIHVTGVLGDTGANGTFTVTVLNANQFALNGSVGNGVYLGGGVFTAVTTVSLRPVALTLNGGVFTAQSAVIANNLASAAGASYFLFATTDAASYAANVANTGDNTDWKMFNQKVASLVNSASPQNANSGNMLQFKAGGTLSPNFTVTMLDQEGTPVRIVGQTIASQASQAGVLAGWQSGPVNFDSLAAVNVALVNSITSPQFQGLVTGQTLLYSSGLNTPIGGLANDTLYYVLTTNRADTIQLTAAPGLAAIALTPTAASTQQSLTVLGDEVYNLFNPTAAGAVTTGAAGMLTSPQFAGLVNGEAVQYLNGGGTSIGGLTNNTTYFVITTGTPNTIELSLTAGGAAVPISSTGTGTQHGLMTLGGISFTPSLISNVNHTITLPSMSFVNGQAVVYHNGGGASIPTLVDGTTYYVVSVGNSNILRLAAVPGGTPLAITSVGAGPLQILAPAIATAATTSAGVASFGSFEIDQSRGDAYTLQAVYTNPDGSAVAAAASSSTPFHVIPATILVLDGNFTQLNTQQSTIVVATSQRGSVRLVALNLGATGLASNSIKVEAYDFLSLSAPLGPTPTPLNMIIAASYNGPITLSANVPLLGNQGLYTMTQGILVATNITPSTSLGTFLLYADSMFNDVAGSVDVRSNGHSTTGAFVRTNPGRQRRR